MTFTITAQSGLSWRCVTLFRDEKSHRSPPRNVRTCVDIGILLILDLA